MPPTTVPTAVPPTTVPPTTVPPAEGRFAPPPWLGTRLLPLRPDGRGEAAPTPPELVDRRLATPPLLPPPPDAEFTATVGPVPDDVLARSSWSPECPVTADELAYLTLSHHGFDGGHHTGEMIVHAAVADDIVGVFARAHEAGFPIEEMRVVSAADIDAPPTGDGNVTTSFACRPAVGSSSWSQHAHGLAVDVNPFHNPYRRGDLVLPELASSYLERDDLRPGMITSDGPVARAFADIGWGWGGHWSSVDDWMHFSADGR